VIARDLRKHLQIGLLIVFVVLGIRLVLIWHQRRAASRPKQEQTVRFPDDYYVTPKKLYAYDIASARNELTHQPVWVRLGYHHAYYPYDVRSHRADFRKTAGLLGPIEKLQITDIVLERLPGDSSQRQVLAVFSKAGQYYAVPIGSEKNGDYDILTEMFFLQEPHELYRYWSPEMWKAIERHEVQKGMNEFQVAFAIGVGIPQGDGSGRTLSYPNGGHPIQITYQNGRAVSISTP
jgi:hypothetical protein